MQTKHDTFVAKQDSPHDSCRAYLGSNLSQVSWDDRLSSEVGCGAINAW